MSQRGEKSVHVLLPYVVTPGCFGTEQVGCALLILVPKFLQERRGRLDGGFSGDAACFQHDVLGFNAQLSCADKVVAQGREDPVLVGRNGFDHLDFITRLKPRICSSTSYV